MPALPGKNNLGGLPSARTGRPIATIDTSAIGEGMRAFGQAVQDVGADLKEKRDRTQLFEAERHFQEFAFNERKLGQEARANIPPGAPGGFADPYGASYKERADAFAQEWLAGLPPDMRMDFDNRLFGLERDLYFDNADAERGEIRRYNIDALDDVLSTLQNQIDLGGHTTLDTYQAEGERLINASALSPVDKVEALENWNEGAARTAWLAHLRDDPQGAIQALGFEPTPGADFQIAGDVRGRANQAYDAFIEFGYTPAQAAGIVGNLVQESGVSPNGAVGDNGTAFGLAQWRGERFEALKRFAAERGTEWTDFQTQLAFIDHELRTSESAAGQRLRAAASVEDAAAAFIGFERPQGWTSANPRGGHGWGNRLAAAQTIAGDPTTSVRVIDPHYQNISHEERERLMSEAQPIIRQRRSDYTERMVNYGESLRAGLPTSDIYDPQEAQSILGPEGAAELARGLDEAEREGQTLNAVALASPAELNAASAAMAAKLVGEPENYIANEREANRLAAAIERRNTVLQADPAAYVMQQNTVGAAYDALAEALTSDDPETIAGAAGLANAYAVASLNEQARLGVREDQRTILTKDYRDAMVAAFKDQDEGGANAAQLMQHLEQTWGRHWPKVYEELVVGGRLPDTAVVVGAMNRPEQRIAAERLAEASTIGQTELNKLIAEDRRQFITDNITNKMSDFIESVQGLPGTDALRYTEAVRLLATMYAQTESGDSALNRAYNDILGVAYSYENSNVGSFRVPVERDLAAVREGAGMALVALQGGGSYYKDGDVAFLPSNVAASPMTARLDIPPPELGMTEDEMREAYLDTLSTARWRTNADETGLALWRSTDNAVVTIDGGKPLTITWDELEAMSALYRGRTPAPAPVPSGPPTNVLSDPMRAQPVPGAPGPAATQQPWAPTPPPAPPPAPPAPPSLNPPGEISDEDLQNFIDFTQGLTP